MTDTHIKRVLYTIKNGIQSVCNAKFNYTNENWYNFKSYICGTEVSFTICKQCNNYKRLSKNVTLSNKPSNQRIICNCESLYFPNDNNFFENTAIIKSEIEMELAFDDFDAVFVDIFNDFQNNVVEPDLNRSIIF